MGCFQINLQIEGGAANGIDWKDFKWRKEAVVTKVISRADRIFVWKISFT